MLRTCTELAGAVKERLFCSHLEQQLRLRMKSPPSADQPIFQLSGFEQNAVESVARHMLIWGTDHCEQENHSSHDNLRSRFLRDGSVYAKSLSYEQLFALNYFSHL